MNFNRVTIIVLDGVGAGEAPDAAAYGDAGSNSLGNTATAVGGLRLPNLEQLGFGCITPMLGVKCSPDARGAFGLLQPLSAGKDTVIGHWEMMGIHLAKPLPTYPNGFPPDLMAEFEKKIGRKTLGNYPASGTEIIKDLGEEHMRTGSPIVYTSADSVFQVAAHEEIIPIDELYRICLIARDLLKGEHAVGRVIARPFLGQDAATFKRTDRRRDYPLLPPTPTVMDRLIDAGKEVWSIGKIDDIFGHKGISHKQHTLDNDESSQAVIDTLAEDFEGLIFANLIEFDMIYGHRNDARGYASALERFDTFVPGIFKAMKPGDIAIITGDHGVDPTTESTDHSREYVPLLVFAPSIDHVIRIGTRGSFADIGATISDIFALEPPLIGKSFLDLLQ